VSVPEQPLPDEAEPAALVHLHGAVRARTLALASDALGAMAGSAADEVPQSLRPFARFTPVRRARLAAMPLAAALEGDPVFRQRVADRVKAAFPELAIAVAEGSPLPAAPPADIAALAYLLRPPGWQDIVLRAQQALTEEHRSGADRRQQPASTSREGSGREEAAARADVARLRAELLALRREHDELRRRLGDARERARKAEREAEALALAADRDRAAVEVATAAAAVAEAESRRLRAKLAATEQTLTAARTAAREGRGSDDARVWLLLDTLVNAAAGLRRELAVPPPTQRPADRIQQAGAADDGFGEVASRGLTDDDPALLDQLLGLPGVHLVVDGYNVTKSGYGTLSLAAQRQRLLAGLSGLAAQSGAELTVVFDGAVREAPVATAAPRGVRLLFSAPGQIADDLIRELVRAEPVGRPIVVVSSDREVADSVRAMGARAVASAALLRRLARG
jgi:predicted RNA-binding protein with PIN domain